MLLAFDVTRAMVESSFCIDIVSVCVESAKTVTPASLAGEYPFFCTETVYESGASDTKMKCPEASVFVVADCEAEDAVTVESASGVCVSESTTMPVSPPVVPASRRS